MTFNLQQSFGCSELKITLNLVICLPLFLIWSMTELGKGTTGYPLQ